MKKPLLIFMYGIAVYFILRSWYAQGNTGLPRPNILVGPTYLYSILTLASDFAENIPVLIGAGLTLALIVQAQNAGVSKGKSGTGTTPIKVPATPANVKTATAGGKAASGAASKVTKPGANIGSF